MTGHEPPQLPVGRSSLEVYCSPHATPDLDPEPALRALIGSATTSILVGAYSFTLHSMAQALIAQHRAGVRVRIVADGGQFVPTSQYPVLQAAGLDIRTWGSGYSLQHMKVVVVDSLLVAWGSYNFSTGAEKSNFEVMTVTSNAKLARILAGQIELAYGKGHPPPAPSQP